MLCIDAAGSSTLLTKSRAPREVALAADRRAPVQTDAADDGAAREGHGRRIVGAEEQHGEAELLAQILLHRVGAVVDDDHLDAEVGALRRNLL